jgi:hypothetical protein
MATGNLYSPISASQGELLRTQLQIYGGAVSGQSVGDADIQIAILKAMQTWPAPDIASLALQPTGCTASTLDRSSTSFVQNIAMGGSGTLQVTAIFVPANTVVNNFNWVSGSTAASGPTHQWTALYDNNLNQLAISADGTSTAIAGNTLITYPVANVAAGASTTFTTTYGGLYYFGILVTVSTTMPTLMGATDAATTIKNIAPKLTGTSSTGLTTPTTFPTTAGAITATVSPFYAYLT